MTHTTPQPAAEQTRTAVARAIWAILREREDRCDQELERCSHDHDVWAMADAAISTLAATPQPQALPAAEPKHTPDMLAAAEFFRLNPSVALLAWEWWMNRSAQPQALPELPADEHAIRSAYIADAGRPGGFGSALDCYASGWRAALASQPPAPAEAGRMVPQMFDSVQVAQMFDVFMESPTYKLAVEWIQRPPRDPRGDLSGIHGALFSAFRDGLWAALSARAALASPADVQPVAWVRVHPDGSLAYDILFDQQIEPARRKSGAWRPLGFVDVAAQPPSPQPDDWRRAAQAAVSHLDYPSGAPKAVCSALRNLLAAMIASDGDPPSWADDRAPSPQPEQAKENDE